MYDKGKSIMS